VTAIWAPPPQLVKIITVFLGFSFLPETSPHKGGFCRAKTENVHKKLRSIADLVTFKKWAKEFISYLNPVKRPKKGKNKKCLVGTNIKYYIIKDFIHKV
jgi:hypothetical protein